MGTSSQNIPVVFDSIPVGTSASVYYDTQNCPFPLTVVAIPGSSGTLLVEFSCTPNAAGKTTTATWISWPSTMVTTTTTDVLISPVSALRFTAGTASGIVEVNG